MRLEITDVYITCYKYISKSNFFVQEKRFFRHRKTVRTIESLETIPVSETRKLRVDYTDHS